MADSETTVPQGLHVTDNSAGYTACKRVLSGKAVLARIMKSFLEEYRDYDAGDIAEKRIAGQAQVTAVSVLPDGGGTVISHCMYSNPYLLGYAVTLIQEISLWVLPFNYQLLALKNPVHASAYILWVARCPAPLTPSLRSGRYVFPEVSCCGIIGQRRCRPHQRL